MGDCCCFSQRTVCYQSSQKANNSSITYQSVTQKLEEDPIQMHLRATTDHRDQLPVPPENSPMKPRRRRPSSGRLLPPLVTTVTSLLIGSNFERNQESQRCNLPTLEARLFTHLSCNSPEMMMCLFRSQSCDSCDGRARALHHMDCSVFLPEKSGNIFLGLLQT